MASEVAGSGERPGGSSTGAGCRSARARRRLGTRLRRRHIRRIDQEKH